MTASGAAPPFFAEVVALLVTTALVAYVCHRVRIMPIVSFLVTGAIIGPHALGIVHDEGLIEAAAELGVVLLLFTIGIEFSLDKLARIKWLILVGGGLQVGLVVGVVAGVLALLGVDWPTGIFTGCLLALSSTAIVMKVLMSQGRTNTEGGQAALGILIFQDLAVVAMVLLVPILAGGGGSGWALPLALGKAALIVILVLLVARRVMPKVLEAVARTCSQEIFLLTVIAICLGTAYLTSLAGVSLSLGAFLAGLIVSESRYGEMAFGEILPLQILFSAMFFVSVGLLLDVGYLMGNPLLVCGVIGASLLIKLVTTGISLKVLGIASSTAAFTSLLLAQIGEFSFVLERAGRELGLYPGGMENGGPQAFVVATVIMMIATPPLSDLCDRLLKRRGASSTAGTGASPAATEQSQEGATAPQDHVIIAGFGDAARALAPVLAEQRIPYVVLTLSPEGAGEAERNELRVMRGNYARQHELSIAGARQARMLVVADDDAETTRRVVAAARALNPMLRIVARTRLQSEIEHIKSAGAADVISEEQEGVVRLLGQVLDAYELDELTIRLQQEALRASGLERRRERADVQGAVKESPDDAAVIRLDERQQASKPCKHTGAARAVIPKSQGCEECLKIGATWVHLRVCMTCGQVSCCDSSKHRHARKHFNDTGHPIVKSLERGESWAWCYEDKIYV